VALRLRWPHTLPCCPRDARRYTSQHAPLDIACSDRVKNASLTQAAGGKYHYIPKADDASISAVAKDAIGSFGL